MMWQSSLALKILPLPKDGDDRICCIKICMEFFPLYMHVLSVYWPLKGKLADSREFDRLEHALGKCNDGHVYDQSSAYFNKWNVK